jgi:hypothetical protein
VDNRCLPRTSYWAQNNECRLNVGPKLSLKPDLRLGLTSPCQYIFTQSELQLFLNATDTLGLRFTPMKTKAYNIMLQSPGSAHVSWIKCPAQSSSVKCCWSSSAQSFLFWGSVETHDHIFVLYRVLHILKWDLPSDQRRGPTLTGHSSSYWWVTLWMNWDVVCMLS